MYTSIMQDAVWHTCRRDLGDKGHFDMTSFDFCVQPSVVSWHAGFVGISEPQGEHKLRDIVVAFRGTIAKSEWLTNITSEFSDWSTAQSSTVQEVKVSLGFDSMYRRFSMSPGNTLSVQVSAHGDLPAGFHLTWSSKSYVRPCPPLTLSSDTRTEACM